MQAYMVSPLLFLLAASVTIYAVATNALAWLQRIRPLSPFCLSLARHIGSFLFFLGIPYLALGGWPRRPLQGLLSPVDLGLVAPGAAWPFSRWLGALSIGIGVGLLTFLVLLVAWRNTHQGHDDPPSFPTQPVWMLLIDGLYLEAHWAFYRGGLSVLLDDVYAGVFLGLALVCVEWGLSPAWRVGWRDHTKMAERWFRAGLALASALLFLFTRNLWVCLLVHWLVEISFWYLFRDRQPTHS